MQNEQKEAKQLDQKLEHLSQIRDKFDFDPDSVSEYDASKQDQKDMVNEILKTKD